MTSRFWVTRAVYGFIVGAAIATLDFIHYLPLISAPGGVDGDLFASSLVLWCGECVLFALALGLAERLAEPGELRAWQLLFAIVAGVCLSVLVWHAFSTFVLRDQLGMRLFRDHVGQPANWAGSMLYHAWLMLFFGGLIAAVAASERSRTRMLAALRNAELGRATSQRQLAEARLASLEGRVDPDYLHHTLSRLERLYEDDPPAADRLLEELIAFMRKALGELNSLNPKEIS
jgi:hypothetical protein